MAASFIADGSDETDELWRECASWLTRWEMLRPDHKANLPGSGIADLANILRDGVLLCKLLHRIDIGCIDMKDVNLKPTMAQFLCLRNINLFLQTCVNSFGLRQSELFEDTMLFDLTNFHRVLCTLSRLSQSPKANQLITGFRAHTVKAGEEDIYHSLKSVELPTRVRGIVEPDYDVTSEEIYQDLCMVKTVVEHPPTLEKRDFVIKELLDTEKNYVEVLEKLKKNFMIPLASLMKPDDHRIVFHQIKDLHEIHSTFYHELQKVRTDYSVRLSNIFMRWREKFLVYGAYCAHLTEATTVLQELCDTDENFNQAVIKYEKDVNNGRFKLRDVLSVPMQRILKYHLLLEKLIENTDKNHEEYNDLKRAREAMLDVAGYINEAARDSEHLAVLHNLQENIVEWQVMPDLKLASYGRLIKDAELKIKAHEDPRTKNRYVFIFDKCILICKQRGNQFAFKDIINVAEYHIDDIHNRAILNREARWSYQFYLVRNNNHTAYTISARSDELKSQIIKAINDALDNIHPKQLQKTNHSFDLKTFSTPTQCLHCSKHLKGLLHQGYKCSTCNIAVHKSCIQFAGRCGTTPWNREDKLWFVGEMDRNAAEQNLQNREVGTFMIRIRRNSHEKDKYAITLKTTSGVTHMKILSTSDSHNDSKRYYLSQLVYFNSIEELVLNYQNRSLRENFNRLEEDTRLLWPYKQLRAVVVANFSATDDLQMSLIEGETIRVIGMEGYREGWWKGWKENQIGFFPLNRVKIEGEIRFDT